MPRLQWVTGVSTVVVSIFVGSATAVWAQDATPAAATTPLTLPVSADAALCTAEPRPLADYEALVGTPVPATPAVYRAITGEPADQATIDAVTATLVELSACFNAGDFRRASSLYTQAGFEEDTLGIDADGVAFFAATPEPAAAGDPTTIIFDATGIQVLADGRVGAIVLFGPGGKFGAAYMIFAQEGDRYLIDHWVDEPFELSPDWDAMAEATPAA